jgi:hypothetical protein
LEEKKANTKYKIELSHPPDIPGFQADVKRLVFQLFYFYVTFFTELHYHVPGGYQADEKARFRKAAGVGQVLH